MKQCVPNSKASFTFSRPIGLDTKTWRYVEPIFEALHQAQHQTGRFKFYDYLTAVYRTYKEWRELGISKRMACHVAEYFNIPQRKGTSPARTLNMVAQRSELRPQIRSDLALKAGSRERNFWMQRQGAKNRNQNARTPPETKIRESTGRKCPQKRPI
jgi:hypothetical protein